MAVLDTSVYVSWLLPSDTHHQAAVAWMSQTLHRGDRVLAPWILAAEVAAAVARNTGDAQLGLQAAHNLTGAGLVQLVPVGPALAQHAATIAARHSIRGCDSIYVALAASSGETLVTFDKEQAARAAAVVAVHQPT